MSNENNRKTLANCKLSEFTAQANKIRKQMYDYYHAIDIPALTQKYANKYKDQDVDKDAVSKEFISDVFNSMMTEHPLETVGIVASMAFMTVDEAEELEPVEALAIVLECIFSKKVIDFFISVERLAGKGTDSILPVLIFLKALSLEMNTSDSESQNNTTDTTENAPVGDMSENA